MQDKLWARIWSLKKECGKLNDNAIRKEAEVTKLEQRLVKEIEFEKQQADGMPDDFASTIAMSHPAQKLNGALVNTEDMVNNAAVFALKSSELSSSVGLCTLTPPDPQLKGAWYPGGFNPCTYQVKNRFQNVPFKIQLAPLHLGARKSQRGVGPLAVEVALQLLQRRGAVQVELS
jgi:hypothetical protein